MRKIRVLVVDDAVVFRKLVSDEIGRDPLLEVAGVAANGKIALAKLAQVSPDLVVLDVEMPELDGLATLKELRKTYPRLPVIMFSALTERGASTTLDALALGASDYFAKPSAEGGLAASLQIVREQLIPKIKALGAPVLASASHAAPALRVRSASIFGAKIEVVAIGCSTGGPNTLAAIFARLPADLPVPIVIVQHMPPTFTRLLAERLTAQFALPVEEGATGTVLRPGRAWIAPGDYHMAVTRSAGVARLLIQQEPPENSCRPAVDVLLRSVAAVYGRNSLTVILTGMGQDGLRGCEHIRDAGGQIIVQDEASSVVWSMPGCVARAGMAERVLPPALLADEIVGRVQG